MLMENVLCTNQIYKIWKLTKFDLNAFLYVLQNRIISLEMISQQNKLISRQLVATYDASGQWQWLTQKVNLQGQMVLTTAFQVRPDSCMLYVANQTSMSYYN